MTSLAVTPFEDKTARAVRRRFWLTTAALGRPGRNKMQVNIMWRCFLINIFTAKQTVHRPRSLWWTSLSLLQTWRSFSATSRAVCKPSLSAGAAEPQPACWFYRCCCCCGCVRACALFLLFWATSANFNVLKANKDVSHPPPRDTLKKNVEASGETCQR